MPEFIVRDDLYRGISRKTLELFKRVGGPGPTKLNPYALERELQRLIERRFLPHNVFVPDCDQIGTVREWNRKRKWELPQQAFNDLPDPPRFSRDLGQERRLVLVPYLETVEQTFMELWAVLSEEFRDNRNWVELDTLELSLLPSVHHPKAPTLRWEVIDLHGHTFMQYEPPDLQKIRKPSESPHAGVLAAAAHMPEYIAGSPGGMWLPGYRVRTKGKRSWDELPFLRPDQYGGGVALEPRPLDTKSSSTPVPTFVKDRDMLSGSEDWIPE